ncbi:MAG: hypothetical protein HND47_14140 [Chloroflexi bacterium]|nr:hypothetical protein [Chloroflexota bacterium]
MIQVENSIVINKPLAEVYTYVTSGEHTTEWQGGVEAVENEGPPNMVGSRYTEVRKFLGQEMRTLLEITEVAQNAKWAAKVVKGPVPYQVTVAFEDSGGGTKMTTRVEGEPTGFFKMAEGMVASQLEKSLAEDSQRLKKILEGG